MYVHAVRQLLLLLLLQLQYLATPQEHVLQPAAYIRGVHTLGCG
jgi:hypothetical protein